MASSSPSAAVIPLSDPASPFYIHPNENPALILVSPPLDGSNYHSWARAMRSALLTKNKLQFIDGSLPSPPKSDVSFPAWERNNNLVQGWLMKSLSPTIAKSILWFDSAVDTWSDLRSRFSQADNFHISDLQEEICNFKQGTLSVSEFYTHLKILWDEIANIRPLQPCTCESGNSSIQHRDNDQVIRFLKGLNEQYSAIKSQIMLLDPLPPINRVFNLVLQQERELHVPTTTPKEKTDQKLESKHCRSIQTGRHKAYSDLELSKMGSILRGTSISRTEKRVFALLFEQEATADFMIFGTHP